MATIKRCDKCGTEDATPETVIAGGVHVDLCSECFGDVFKGAWFENVRARIDTAPVAPARARGLAGRGPRPPQHGFTATAIERSQDPSQAVTLAESIEH